MDFVEQFLLTVQPTGELHLLAHRQVQTQKKISKLKKKN